MRLFAALVPPADVLDELEAFTAPFRAEWPDLRWCERDLFHVTLAFFGEVDDNVLELLQPRLERASSNVRSSRSLPTKASAVLPPEVRSFPLANGSQGRPSRA